MMPSQENLKNVITVSLGKDNHRLENSRIIQEPVQFIGRKLKCQR